MDFETKKTDKDLLNAVNLDKVAEGNVEHTTLLDIAMGRVSLKEGAERLNIGYGAIRGRIYRIKHRRDKSKPYSKEPGPKSRYKVLEHTDLIREYRKKGLTSEEISDVIGKTISADISSITIGRFLSEEGFPRMYNRTAQQKEETQMAIKEIIIGYKTRNGKDINQQIRDKFESSHAGLGIFMALIEELNILKIIRDAYPSNAKLIQNYVLSLLALKLIQKKRRSNIEHLSEEEMIALFSGRDKVLSSTALHRFDYDIRKNVLEAMKMTYIQVLRKYLDMSVLNIDFHVVPHFGGSEVLEINHSSSRGKNMKGALVFLVQDRESKIFTYSHANIKRSDASDETIKFLDKIERINIKPEWLVIDSKVTTYKNIEEIKKREVDVVTIRRRGGKMIEEVEEAKKDPNVWTTVRIKRTKGGWEKIKVWTKTITIGYHDDNKKWRKMKMRQLAIPTNHEEPMFLITTDFKHSIKDIIEMYPPRWLIELGIKTQTKFFDINQLASDLDVKIDFDTFLTQIAHMLYQILAKNLYCHENSEPEKTYQKFIEGCGKIKIYEDKVVVQLKKKRSTGYLINAPILEGWIDGGKNISWLGKKLEIIWE